MNNFMKPLSLVAVLVLAAEANTDTVPNFPIDTLCTYVNTQVNPNQLDLPVINIAMCNEQIIEVPNNNGGSSSGGATPTPEIPVEEEPIQEPEIPVVEEPIIPDNPVIEEPIIPVEDDETIVVGTITKPVTNDETDDDLIEKVTGVTTQVPETNDDGTKTTIQMLDEDGKGDKKTEVTIPKDVTKVVTSTQSGTSIDLESDKTKSEVMVNNNGTIDTKVINKDTGKEFDIKSSALGTDITVKDDGSFEMSVENTDVIGQDIKVKDVDKDETISQSTTTLKSDGLSVEAQVLIKTKDPLTGEETTTTKTIDTPVTENTKVLITSNGSIQLKEESINSVQIIDPDTNELTDANINSLLEIKPDGTTIHIIELTTENGTNIQTSATSNLAGSKTEKTENGLHTTANITTHIVENGVTKNIQVDIEVTADISGKATHSMSIINDNGESVTTSASSDLVGASTNISDEGKIETSINLNNGEDTVELKAVANADGSFEHSVKFKEPKDGETVDDVTTKATSKIVGAQTKITTSGGINTSVEELIGDETIKAIIETDIDGNSITKFEKYDSEGNLLDTQNTTRGATQFEPGNKVIIENVDGKTTIDTTAKVSGIIEF